MSDKIERLASDYNRSQTLEDARQRRSELFAVLVHDFGPAGFVVEDSQQEFVADGYPMIRTIMLIDGDQRSFVVPDQWTEEGR